MFEALSKLSLSLSFLLFDKFMNYKSKFKVTLSLTYQIYALILDETFIFLRAIDCLRHLQEDWSVHSSSAVYPSIQEVHCRRLPVHQGAGQRKFWKSKFNNLCFHKYFSNRSFLSFRVTSTLISVSCVCSQYSLFSLVDLNLARRRQVPDF